MIQSVLILAQFDLQEVKYGHDTFSTFVTCAIYFFSFSFLLMKQLYP